MFKHQKNLQGEQTYICGDARAKQHIYTEKQLNKLKGEKECLKK